MRRLIVTLAIISTCLGAVAQGKITLGNDALHLIYDYSGVPIPQAGGWTALTMQLMAGTNVASMTLQTTIVGDAIGSPSFNDGRINNRNITLIGVPTGATAYLQLLFFPTTFGSYNAAAAVGACVASPIFTVTTGNFAPNSIVSHVAPSYSTWPDVPVFFGCLSCYPPRFVAAPSNAAISLGSDVTFTAIATGFGVRYQWRRGGWPVNGATNASLTLTNVTLSDAGNYDVLASNNYGSTASTAAILTVFIPTSITNEPVTQVVAAHETATFSVGAAGYPAPNYAWRFNGVVVAGANSSSLVVTNVRPKDLGSYWVELWNAYSSATSAPVALLMSPSLQVPFAGLVATSGKEATLAVTAWGSGELSYQWHKDGQVVSGASHGKLVFPAVQTSDGGLYGVVVSSVYGAVTNPPAQLVINPANVSLGRYAGMTIEGVAGWTYGIEYASELTDASSWQSLTNITLAQPVELWVDESTDVNSSTAGKRFYRSANNPALLALGLYAGIRIDGEPGRTYQIEYSGDLTDPNSWQSLTNITLVQPVELWVDRSRNVNLPSVGRRFYQVSETIGLP